MGGVLGTAEKKFGEKVFVMVVDREVSTESSENLCLSFALLGCWHLYPYFFCF